MGRPWNKKKTDWRWFVPQMFFFIFCNAEIFVQCSPGPFVARLKGCRFAGGGEVMEGEWRAGRGGGVGIRRVGLGTHTK